ncbi:HNH endonuclease [Paenibacillus agaridevorans]|uniref:HNH endonuclease n=1 Tax=Paenibacillus agaridevorans TaxID=171404 RepID=A0A2R5EI58_9BACL|nr:HNH endonuclease [Paenibacillus agaridevorans]GBG06197.1 HNH endonuclease [Paenibacillus agaridevorans]
MHQIDCTGKVFTKTELIHANNASIREGRNRALKEDYLESLPDDFYFPICLALDEHNRGEIRVQIVLDFDGTKGFLDLTKKRYDYLPIAKINEDGVVELEYILGKPYPDEREYVEKVVRSVVRNKDFRKNVLLAYGNQCAMCEIKDVAALVAAHIYPAHLCADDSVNNGICLCSTHDSAYEKGTICINADGEIINYSDSIKVSYLKIRVPMNINDYPSPERLSQRLEISRSNRV